MAALMGMSISINNKTELHEKYQLNLGEETYGIQQ